MSDRDAPDPMDKAYAEAEALLADEAARTARRARVLAAVEQAQPQVLSQPRRAWRYGGALAAASVAGLSVLLANQIKPPVTLDHPIPPPAPSAVAEPKPRPKAAPETVTDPAPAAPGARATASATKAPAAAAPVIEAAPPPPASLARAEAPSPVRPAPAPPATEDSFSEVVVTGSRIAAPEARAAAAPVPADRLAARLRAAAARGRIAELEALLARGVPVDAADENGDTALMQSIRGHHPEAAALLRRHGASPDRRNGAGQSARDLATSVGDADLVRALDVEP